MKSTTSTVKQRRKANFKQNEQRFNELLESFTPVLYGRACRLCGDRSQAQDLVQETFLRAWRFLDRLESPEAMRSWMFTILQRENARHYQRYQPQFSEVDFELMSGEPNYTDADVLGICEALDGLPEKYRKTLALRVDGHSCQEISEMVGINKVTVMTRVHRARRMLQKALDGADQAIEPQPAQ
ncbi:MAG: sigma-70 family RNA polymerase sigma factor [Gammaproteobacteria bacterium]